MDSDPRVLSAHSLRKSTEVDAVGTKSVYYPVLRGTGSLGSIKSNDPLSRDGSKRTIGLEMEQPIPLFGREAAHVAKAESAVAVERAGVSMAEQAVLSDILDALVAVEAAEKALALRGQLAENMASQLKFTRLAVADGGLKITEERLLLSQAAQAEALKTMASTERSTSQLRLARLLQPPNKAPTLKELDLAAWWTGALTLEALEGAALAGSPSLLKAKAEAAQVDAEVTSAKADLWPRLSLNLQGTRGTFGDASANSSGVFLGLSVPLFEGGAGASRAESAQHRLEAAQQQAEFEQRLVGERMAEAWMRWQASNEVVAAWDNVEQQELASVALAKEQVAKGGITVIALLKTQESLLRSQLQAAAQRAQRDSAWVQVLAQSGALLARLNSANAR